VNNTNDAEALFFAGTSLLKKGDATGAENCFRMAIKLAPGLAEAHANLGLLLEKQARFDEAESSYRKAIDLMPSLMQNHLNYGAMLAGQKRFAEAEIAYREALSIDPQSPSAWSNLGALLACMKQEAEAESCYRQALAFSPGYRSANFNLAYLLLRQGRYEEGWKRLESRDWYGPLENVLNLPRWQGESLKGKTILIGYEAGHGDMIQFCRYASLLKESGASKVSMLCHPPLKALFASIAGVDEVIGFDEQLPDYRWNYWIPPLSLPAAFSTRLNNIPAKLPYLHADPVKITHWAGFMIQQQKLPRVGLVWKGNPNFENDADRSLASIDELAPLAGINEIQYYSLQKGAGETEASNSSMPLVDLAPYINDFSDTAAIVMNLDLVITVDTAIAHLAGALGKPCWIMLPDYRTDWRWLADRKDTPWYPGITQLFRQKKMGDWTEVISEIKSELLRLF